MKKFIWSHRGYRQEGAAENTVASLKAAYLKGYKGVELDLWYLDGNLRLHHNKPKRFSFSKLPLLRKYLKTYKHKLRYWFDLKNINEKNCDSIFSILKRELDKWQIPYEQVSLVPYNSNWLEIIPCLNKAKELFPGINVGVYMDKESIESYDMKQMKELLVQNSIALLSFDYETINQELINFFENCTNYAWTVNSEEEIQRLQKLGITNFCTDKILP